MKITIDLTPEREAALERSRVSANPDEATRPTLEDYGMNLANQTFDAHVAIWKDRDAGDAFSKVTRHKDKLTQEDLDAIAAIGQKYDPAPVVDPIPEP